MFSPASNLLPIYMKEMRIGPLGEIFPQTRHRLPLQHGHHLQKDTSQRTYIGQFVSPLDIHHLRRSVDHRLGAIGGSRPPSHILPVIRDSEVGQEYLVALDDDILGFDVAVADADSVKLLERIHQTAEKERRRESLSGLLWNSI